MNTDKEWVRQDGNTRKDTDKRWVAQNGNARTDTDRTQANALMERVIGAVFEVSNTLGVGFLEKVYERALVRELAIRGVRAMAQVPLTVRYKGDEVGEYFADILVEDVLMVELKCAEGLANEHTAQCLNYLKASGLGLCLLVNFQRPQVEYKRIAH
jgi:GxxExxY protein